MKLKIVNKSKHRLPSYSTKMSAGMDLRANIEGDIILKPMERAKIPTGLYIELPDGYEAQVRPRSGLAINYGITVLNTPGTIDADYRGEICAIMINLSGNEVRIKDGDRICQMIINKYEKAEFVEMDHLDNTDRGAGGFGHTGKK